MKKLLLSLALFSICALVFAQENETVFNRWSVELNVGLNKPSRPFADDYFVNTPSFGQGSIGVRYMLNDRFGLKADFGYNAIEADSGSLPFEASYYRASLEGVINLGHILRFSDWTNRVGFLFHAGAGYSILDVDNPIDTDADGMMNIVAGLTPQFKLSDRLAFTLDISLIGHVGQSTTWDGTELPDARGIEGSLYNYSAGITYYIGKNAKHLDWNPEESLLKSELEELKERVATLETDLLDTDRDGVADYLDREQNTHSGVTVDTKGVAVDMNENGIPDEIESSLNQRFVNEEDYSPNTGNSGIGIKELLNKGYVNVYFRFNSDIPENYSLGAINYLMTYMQDNPSAKAELIGYADEIGDTDYNIALSEKRAQRVQAILVASGISEDRLTINGRGEDTSADTSSSPARQLVRRVTFRLK